MDNEFNGYDDSIDNWTTPGRQAEPAYVAVYACGHTTVLANVENPSDACPQCGAALDHCRPPE